MYILLLGAYRPTRADQQSTDPALIGAGDIAVCSTDGDEATARLLDKLVDPRKDRIFTAGDNVYSKGTIEEYQKCYEPSWGRWKRYTRPALGNHDYVTPGARPYFVYFGLNAGPAGRGYYSFKLGQWFVVVLNSSIDGRKVESAQAKWLRAELEKNPTACTMAIWHHPLFASTTQPYTDRPRDVKALWEVLYEYKADVIVNGHIHRYERFAPQTPDGQAHPERGIRQFVVGTGGANLADDPLLRTQPNSEVRNASTWGVIKFTLHPTSYDWEFIPVEGGNFRDSGSTSCTM